MSRIFPNRTPPSERLDKHATSQYLTGFNPRVRGAAMDELTPSGLSFNMQIYDAMDPTGRETWVNVGSADGLDEIRAVKERGHSGLIYAVEPPAPKIDDDEPLDKFAVAKEIVIQEGIDNIRFIDGYGQNLHQIASRSVNMYTALGVIYHVPAHLRWRVFKEALRVLRTGGKAGFGTNDEDNHPRMHEMIGGIAEQTGSKATGPLSASCNGVALRRLVHTYFVDIKEVPRKEPQIIRTEKDKALEIAAVETYWGSLDPVPGQDEWLAARRANVDIPIEKEIAEKGYFEDKIRRIGYIGTKPSLIHPARWLTPLGLRH